MSDLLVVLLREPGEATEPDKHFVAILGFIGFISLCLTFFLKWFLFRFLINPKRVQISSPWAIVILIIGSIAIWALTKSVEIYGLVFFFGSESIVLYLGFWIPSILVMLIHVPFLLDPRRARNESAEHTAVPPATVAESK